MAIQITNVIKPIEIIINDLTFNVPRSDKRFKEADEAISEWSKEYEAISEQEGIFSSKLDGMRDSLITVVDTFLREGAYEEIEKNISDNDGEQYTLKMASIFKQIVDGYSQEMAEDFYSKYQREE